MIRDLLTDIAANKTDIGVQLNIDERPSVVIISLIDSYAIKILTVY